MAKEKIIGIDLGTTNSVVSVMEGDQPVVITNAEGSRLTPSIVGFTEGGERLVGILAKRQSVTNPNNTVFSIKRFMGRRHEEVKDEERMVPYEIVGAPHEPVQVRVRGKDYTPPEISAMVLEKLKQTAEDHLGEKVTEAVITVPAYFNDAQRQATKDAGQIAGLNVRRIINEPTAAALAYGLDRKKDEKIAVFDLGGGTFDISILEVGDNVVEVKATNGDTHLGGDDFDDKLILHVVETFKKDNGIDLTGDTMALQRLKEACEKAKCELSTAMETEVNLPFITADQSGPKHLHLRISRARFEGLVQGLVERCRGPVLRCLEDAKLNPGQIDEVVLVGGSTRMPFVQRLVKEIFGKEPNRSVNPDEVVAVGAAIQGGVLTGEVSDVLLLDVTPLSLGVEVQGGIMHVLIPRNTTIPTSKKEVFSTAADNQPAVTVRVFQGEREMAENNRLLGQFDLTGIPPARRGMPQIEVSFDIDANGILNVSATDKGTGRAQSIQVKSSSGLSDAEISRMAEDAEKNREEDKKKRKLVEARNKADQVVYQTEDVLKEHGDKIGADEKKKIEDGIASVKKVMEGSDAEKIEKEIEALIKASQAIAEVLYRQTAGAAGGDGAADGDGGTDPVGGNGRGTSGAGGRVSGDATGGREKVIEADYKIKE